MTEREALIDFIVAARDQSQNMVIVCEGLLRTLEPGEAKEKSQPKPQTPAVVEQTFLCLLFEPQTGQKIGAYDVAYEPQNLEENWTRALDILKANNAIIEKRYHGPSYKFSYWLFGEHKIYRQALKQPS
jgi:hypothetical protein